MDSLMATGKQVSLALDARGIVDGEDHPLDSRDWWTQAWSVDDKSVRRVPNEHQRLVCRRVAKPRGHDPTDERAGNAMQRPPVGIAQVGGYEPLQLLADVGQVLEREHVERRVAQPETRGDERRHVGQAGGADRGYDYG